MKHGKLTIGLGFLFSFAGIISTALASPYDHFGASSRAAAMGGAYTSLATDFTGPFYNPAGIVFSNGSSVGLGTFVSTYNLQINNEKQEIDPFYGITAGAVIPFGGMFEGRTALGVMIFLARHNLLYDMTSVPQDVPRFIIEQDRPAQTQILPVLSIRLAPGLSIGGGLQVNQYLWSRVLVQTDTSGIIGLGESPIPLSEMDVTNVYKGFPLGGLYYRPLDNLRFGFVYREDMHFRLDVDSVLIITGANLLGAASDDAVVNILIKCLLHYTPRQATLGTAYDLNTRTTLSLDITWMDWSAYPNPAPNMEVSSPVPEIDAALDNTNPPMEDLQKPGFSDTLIARLGAEYRLKDWLFLRGGYAYIPSPVPEQNDGITNFLDSSRHLVTLGAGFKFIDPIGISVSPVRIDLHLQYHHLAERQNTRDYTGKGSILNTGLNLEFSF